MRLLESCGLISALAYLLSEVVLAALLMGSAIGCASKAKDTLLGTPNRRLAYQVLQQIKQDYWNKVRKEDLHQLVKADYEKKFVSYIEDSLDVGLTSDQIVDLYVAILGNFREIYAHQVDYSLIGQTFFALNASIKSLKNEVQLNSEQIYSLSKTIAEFVEPEHIKEHFVSLYKKAPELQNVQILGTDHIYALLMTIARNPKLDMSKALKDLPVALESLKGAGMDENQILNVVNMIAEHADEVAYRELPMALDVLQQYWITNPDVQYAILASIPEHCGSNAAETFRSFSVALMALENHGITNDIEKATMLIVIVYMAKYYTSLAYDVLPKALAIQDQDLDVLFDDLLIEISRKKKLNKYGTPENIRAVVSHPSFKRFISTYDMRFPNTVSIVEAIWEHIDTGPIKSERKVGNVDNAIAKLFATLEKFVQTSILDPNTDLVILTGHPYHSTRVWLIKLAGECGVTYWSLFRGKNAFLRYVSSPVVEGTHRVVWCPGIKNASGRKSMGPISAREFAKAIIAGKDVKHTVSVLVFGSFGDFARDVYKELYEIQMDLLSRKKIDAIEFPFIIGASNPRALISALGRVHKDGTPLTGRDFFEAHESSVFEGVHEWMFLVLTRWAEEDPIGDGPGTADF